MNKKLTGAICGCIMMISGGACAIGYVVGKSNFPWWLLAFIGGVTCAIVSMIGEITREKKQDKKKKKIVDCICASICMVSVLVFLGLMMFTSVQHSWIVVMVGGIASGVIHLLYDAMKKENKKENKQ